MRFQKGDTIRFVKTGITAKIIGIGPDPSLEDDLEIRYHLKISADDQELVVGERNEILKMTIPVKNESCMEKI